MKTSTSKLLEQLQKYPLFNLTTIARKINVKGNYLKLLVHRLIQRKEILTIEKNKYTLCKDPWIVASHIVWPSYITGWAALRHHNLTEQLPNTIEVITSSKRKKRELLFQGMKIKIITTTPALMFGFNKLSKEEKEIFVAEPEKALLDAALFKSMSFSEISEVLKYYFTRFRKEKMIDYLLKIGNKSLIKRFGFILDSMGNDYHKRLRTHLDRNYVLLDYSLPQRGEKNQKWRIVNNVIKRGTI